MCRYQIQYTVSDAEYVAAKPIAISITFVEVAVVTGSFLLIGQAANSSLAQQQAAQLNTTASAANSALATAVATVYQTWLAAATSSYVGQLTSSLGASAATVAASNTLHLGQFSSVGVPDVTILAAAIDQKVSAALNTDSSSVMQNYAYNVTLQVAVLTSDMLLSVFVDVLNSTGYRRRLLSSEAPAERLWPLQKQKQAATMHSDAIPIPVHEHVLVQHRASAVAVNPSRHLMQSTSSNTSPFPLASLLQFKMDLVLAAFTGTSGCSTDSLTDLFYQHQEPPADLATLCGADNSAADYSLSQALLNGANSSVSLLQVRTYCIPLALHE